MKVSVKLLDDHSKTQTKKNPNTNTNPIHFSAKIPIAVFGLPFLSAFTTTHNHHHPSNNLSLSLRTHFTSGPSLKLSYNATSSQPPATSPPPLSLTLKSGISLSGSPINSPLTISASFSFSPQNPNPNPTFLIHFKPKMGSFSLRKAISSVSESEGKKGSGNGVGNGENENSFGFVPLDRTVSWKGMTVDSVGKDSILSGVLVSADTELPVTKRVKVNLRWGVGVPSEFDKQLPYLRVNKIKIERIDEVKEDEDQKASELGEFDMLKGMYSWMSKELSELQIENREMRRALEDIKSRQVVRNQNKGYSVGGGEATTEGFEQWRTKKNGGGGGELNGQREVKKNGGSSDVESELQRAIKAASSP